MYALFIFIYTNDKRIMETDKEKDKAYITPEIDELVKEVIETDDEEEADLIAEILKEEPQDKSA